MTEATNHPEGQLARYTHQQGSFEIHRAIVMAVWELAGGNPVLDLGVGEGHVSKHFDGVYVDLVVRPTAPAKTMRFDICEAPERLKDHHYKLVMMTDVIEHLLKLDGNRLLERLDAIADAKLIFTPEGPCGHMDVDPESVDPDTHKSVWYHEEMLAAGWSVILYDKYHNYEDGTSVGAFFAWKFKQGTPTPVEVLRKAALL